MIGAPIIFMDRHKRFMPQKEKQNRKLSLPMGLKVPTVRSHPTIQLLALLDLELYSARSPSCPSTSSACLTLCNFMHTIPFPWGCPSISFSRLISIYFSDRTQSTASPWNVCQWWHQPHKVDGDAGEGSIYKGLRMLPDAQEAQCEHELLLLLLLLLLAHLLLWYVFLTLFYS